MSEVMFNINNYATVELVKGWEKTIEDRFEKYNTSSYSITDSIIQRVSQKIEIKKGKHFYKDQLHTIIDNFGDCFSVGMSRGIYPYIVIDKKDLDKFKEAK